MIYYIFILIFPFFSFVQNKNFKLFVLFCGFIYLVFFCSMRWQTGTDWIPYYDDFMNPGTRHDFEIGYVTYVNTLRMFTNSYTFFLFVTTAIPVLLVFLGCYNFSKNLTLTILSICVFYSYYYLGSFFGAERRIIAIGISFYALMQYVNGKRYQAFSLILLASTFHVSSLSTLAIFLINKLSLKSYKKSIVLGVVLAIPLSVYFSGIISQFINYIPIEIIKYKLTVYTENAQNYGTLSIFGIFKRLLVCALFFYVLATDIQNCKKIEFLVKNYVFGCLVYLLLSPISPMFSVISIYFTMVEILLVPLVIMRLGVFTIMPVLILLFVAYLSYQTFSILNSYPELFYPYISVFSDSGRQGIY